MSSFGSENSNLSTTCSIRGPPTRHILISAIHVSGQEKDNADPSTREHQQLRTRIQSTRFLSAVYVVLTEAPPGVLTVSDAHDGTGDPRVGVHADLRSLRGGDERETVGVLKISIFAPDFGQTGKSRVCQTTAHVIRSKTAGPHADHSRRKTS
ncbi:hypothetical protein BD309DRAFT_658627 [Dichomitus squalens]|nr:hypothetical protein BD309DRAFT_658627 [Dichomitus squalens]